MKRNLSFTFGLWLLTATFSFLAFWAVFSGKIFSWWTVVTISFGAYLRHYWPQYNWDQINLLLGVLLILCFAVILMIGAVFLMFGIHKYKSENSTNIDKYLNQKNTLEKSIRQSIK